MADTATDGRALAAFLRRHAPVLVVTGAGISADSGIPTYRDDAGIWRHASPIRHREFLDSADARRRYWARSWYGWPAVRDARPNGAHLALARLERAGLLALLVTQNVDRLHQRAGSRRVVDLHGRLDRVRCLACRALEPRDTVQARLAAETLAWPQRADAARPDGDADIAATLWRQLQAPRCRRCEGDLMPDVVFFGGSIPGRRLRACELALQRAGGVLAVGSSLQVFSGFRLCRDAHRAGKPLAILNPGVTRADALAQLRLATPAGDTLAQAAGLLA